MECPQCGTLGFKTHCKTCSHTNKPSQEDKYPTKTGRTDTIILRNCDFVTGGWKCQWRQWASDRDLTVYCDFHQIIMKLLDRYGVTYGNSGHQWEEFTKERLWQQQSGRQSAYPMNFMGDQPEVSFWFRPIHESWHILVGLPVPTGINAP